MDILGKGIDPSLWGLRFFRFIVFWVIWELGLKHGVWGDMHIGKIPVIYHIV